MITDEDAEMIGRYAGANARPVRSQHDHPTVFVEVLCQVAIGDGDGYETTLVIIEGICVTTGCGDRDDRALLTTKPRSPSR